MSKINIREWKHFINGEWLDSKEGKTISNLSPTTGEEIGTIARGDEEDVRIAVDSAEKGFNKWSKLDPHIRGQKLIQYANLLRERKEIIAELETFDTGKPLKSSLRTVETAARYFEYYAGYADKILGEVIPTSGNKHAYTLREPYGIIANIMPWNSPITGVGKGVGAALAAGNSVVVKCSEFASLSTLYLAELAFESGLPAGVFNVITGFGNEAGISLTQNTKINKITFTGSVATGTNVMIEAAKRITPVTLELGGKSPNIVFEDADLNMAAKGSVKAFVSNTGQICSAGTRLLVHKSVKKEFEELLVNEIKEITVDKGEYNPDIGPIVSKPQLDKVLSYIEIGKQEGAKLLYGGDKINKTNLKNGYFVEPTIFTDVYNYMRIAQDEIFGPILSVITFDTEEEALEIANDTQYGLAAGIWTKNIDRVMRLVPKISAGNIYINEYQGTNVEVPFGGYKNSGIGRDRGIESVLNHTQLKSVITSYREF